jgi:hypothetical protein
MREALAGTPIQSEAARLVHQALPGSIALCEPWFGHVSVALSPPRLHFKVHVINDPGLGLVRLFEMYRIDKHGLRDLIGNGEIHVHLPSFSGKSAFLKSAGDASAGVAAFRTCIDNLGIDAAMVVASEATFMETIDTIHEKLVPVLVENMPVLEFITRFDRPYTVFFVPRIHGSIDVAVEAISAAMGGLKGYLLFESGDEDEIRDSFATHAKDIAFTLAGTVAAPVHASKARRFVILKRVV